MSMQGIQGTALRDLFAMIGRNIAGDPLMSTAVLPGPAADPFVSSPVPRSGSDPGFASHPLVADTSVAQSVSLAGLRDPAGANDTLAARIAMRGELVRLISLLSPSTLSLGEQGVARESEAQGDPAERPASGPQQPSASPRSGSLGSLLVAGTVAMDRTGNSSSPDKGHAAPTAFPAPMLDNDSAVASERMAAEASQLAAHTGLASTTLHDRLAVFSLAAALERLLIDESALMKGGVVDASATFTQSLQAERAGVMASFILNAAMIPGWPPPRPIEGVRVAVSRVVLEQKELTDADRDLLLHLGKLLNSPETLRRLLRKAVGSKRSKLMAALDFILTVMDDVTALLLAELKRIEDLIRDEQEKKRQRLVLR